MEVIRMCFSHVRPPYIPFKIRIRVPGMPLLTESDPCGLSSVLRTRSAFGGFESVDIYTHMICFSLPLPPPPSFPAIA